MKSKMVLLLFVFNLCMGFAQTASQASLPNSEQSEDQIIAQQVKQYLESSQNRYARGQNAYYARQALAYALKAYEEGNYGIGAVVLLVHDGTIYEFAGKNAMVTGTGITDHAEARALEDAVAYKTQWIEKGKNQYGKQLNPEEQQRSKIVQPMASYAIDTNQYTSQFTHDGYYVYGTLEPCPMCMVMIINAKAQQSISSALDGDLVDNKFLNDQEDQKFSNGGAMAIGDKFKYNPYVWQWIANGQKLQFKQLSSMDTDLLQLSEKIFSSTRQAIDDRLAKTTD